jgi:hypothetical protein
MGKRIHEEVTLSSLGNDLAMLFARELDHMAEEIEAYENETDLWMTQGSQRNPPGALVVHVTGALNHFVGASLGKTGYTRDRDAEFTGRGATRADILARLRECRDMVVRVLRNLDAKALEGPMPGPVPPAMQGMTTQGFLMHHLWHVGWHTGHIYYHRLGAARPE